MKYIIGVLVGLIIAVFLFSTSDSVVFVHGKYAFQTIELHDINYRLIPIDSNRFLESTGEKMTVARYILAVLLLALVGIIADIKRERKE